VEISWHVQLFPHGGVINAAHGGNYYVKEWLRGDVGCLGRWVLFVVLISVSSSMETSGKLLGTLGIVRAGQDPFGVPEKPTVKRD